MDWSQVLDAGEEIRWEGRPAPRCFTFRNWKHSLFGVLLFFIAIYWQVIGVQLAAVYDASYMAWLPVPFWLVGLYLSIGHLVRSRLEWEKIFYAVSDRRVLTVRGIRRQRVDSLPLAEVTYFQLRPVGKEVGTVRVYRGEPLKLLVLACIEHPRNLTLLLEETMDPENLVTSDE